VDKSIKSAKAMIRKTEMHPVADRATKRHFSESYKARILRKLSECTERGEVTKLLRREHLYDSLVYRWKKNQNPEALGSENTHDGDNDPKIGRSTKVRITKTSPDARSSKLQVLVQVQKMIIEMIGNELNNGGIKD